MQSGNPATNIITVRSSNIQVSDSAGLNSALAGLSETLISAATSVVDATIDPTQFSGLQRRSMIVIEALRLTSGMDLAAIITRGTLIQQIELEGLVSVHPGQYTTLESMAADQGISTGELSDTRAMCQVIFPYIENDLGMSIAAIWTGVGKSTFREMVPALRSMITGEQPAHGSVRTSVSNLLDQAAISLVIEELIPDTTEGLPDEQLTLRAHVIRDRAIRDLLTLGANAPTRTIRQTLRPSRTPAITGVIMAPFDGSTLSGEGYILMKINGQDQLDMYRRLMGDHVVTTTLNANNDTESQQNGPRQYISQFRRLFGAGE